MGATESVVQFILETHFENIPPEAVEKARRAFWISLGLC